MTTPVQVCPLYRWGACKREECAWWVPKHEHCAVCFIAEVAIQLRNILGLLDSLVQIRDLLTLPPEK